MPLAVKQHGFWKPYKPSEDVLKKFPPLPPLVMFCRREEDGMDWYLFSRGNWLVKDSNKMTVMQMEGRWIVQAVYKDPTMLFPQNCLLIEVTGVTDKDPQKAFGQREFFPSNDMFGEIGLPKPLGSQSIPNLLARIEALEAKLKDKL